MSDANTTTPRWNLPPGGDNADGPRPSDGAITGIDGPDPDAPKTTELPPTDFVRQVAMGICQSRSFEGVSCCQWPSNRGRTDCPVKRGGYDDAARNAIEVMKVFGDE